ncbi:MAG: 3-deoxy-D-manno-octulosonic acid kinase [Polaribacter sp.]|jgi:3-deoxy-D-manno-octulosonic acid kinase
MKIINSKNTNLLIPDNRLLLSESSREDELNQCFNIDFWKDSHRVSGQSKGRNVTWFVEPQSSKSQWVLRHYYRGGLISKMIDDQYLYLTLERTRVYKEICLLDKMIEMDLPVPKAIGGRVKRSKLFYQADLIMEKLDAKDLVAHLNNAPLTEKIWRSIGHTIAKFHNCGIFHADLNAHNIMLNLNDEGNETKVWIIDFDQCELRLNSSSWKNNNMERLKRSFQKEKNKFSSFNYNDESWTILKTAYLSELSC